MKCPKCDSKRVRIITEDGFTTAGDGPVHIGFSAECLDCGWEGKTKPSLGEAVATLSKGDEE